MSTNPASPQDLLASLLATFKKPLPGEKKKAQASFRKQPPALPLADAFAREHTGYTSWKAVSRIIVLEEQHCTCCGSVTTAVKDELFSLENGLAKSSWLRHEGYGIEAQEDLPCEPHHLPPRYVTACADCLSTPLDQALAALLNRSHVQLSFPF